MKLPLASAFLLALAAPPVAAQLGHIDFPTSAQKPAAQRAFLNGVLLLHSFEYEDARQHFQSARELEPGFAMATWGEVLTYHHPIWRREESDEARAALAQLGTTPAERRALAGTDLEKAWLGSVEVLFGEGPRVQRWSGYRDALATMNARYPHDVEIGAMYSLSILGTSFGGRDTRIYMQAAGVAQPFYRRYPDHPGLLHYLIHSYDDPIHAPLGIPMARRYDKVAPAAGHALHMPSHIYVALGMWQDSIRANEASFAAEDVRRAAKELGVDERGWHACQWLAYSYLQRGRAADAAKLLETVWRDHGTSQSKRMRYHVVVMRAAHLVNTRDWKSPFTDLEVDMKGLRKSTVAADHFALAMAALARDDVTVARRHGKAVRAIAPSNLALTLPRGSATCCAPNGQRPETLEDQLAALVIAREIEAAIAAHEGRSDDAISLMAQACARQDTMDVDFGPPIVPMPAHQMMGELLLALGKPAEAIPEFEAALLRAPRRAQAMLGLARARLRSGDVTGARTTYQELAAIWEGADANTSGLDEVRREASATSAGGVPPSGR